MPIGAKPDQIYFCYKRLFLSLAKIVLRFINKCKSFKIFFCKGTILNVMKFRVECIASSLNSGLQDNSNAI